MKYGETKYNKEMTLFVQFPTVVPQRLSTRALCYYGVH